MNKRERENSLLLDKITIQEKKASELAQKSVESLKDQSKDEMKDLLNDLLKYVHKAKKWILSELKETEESTQDLNKQVQSISKKLQNLEDSIKSATTEFQKSTEEMDHSYQSSLKKLMRRQFLALFCGTIVSWGILGITIYLAIQNQLLSTI